ncbi:MAG: hypothetical protein AAGA33_12165 [Pseudomonadota bacterium]
MSGLAGLLILALLAIFWIYPIAKGLEVARSKNYSPAWMWFGIHPIGAWIAYAVLQSVAPLLECPQCAEKVKSHAKICPYCMYRYVEE